MSAKTTKVVVDRPSIFYRIRIWLFGVCALLLCVFIGVSFWGWQSLAAQVSPVTAASTFKIESGERSQGIADRLQKDGYIRSSFWLLAYMKVSHKSFLPGIYTLSAAKSSLENVSPVFSGVIAERQLTIREGLRANEIAALLEKNTIVKASDFLAAVRYNSANQAVLNAYGLKENDFLEGFLFPDTYRFAADATATDVVSVLTKNYGSRTKSLTVSYNTLILASIVEREAKFDEDRAGIAGVFVNRLALGMPLQSNPTVEYAKAMANCGAQPLDSCVQSNWWPVPASADFQSLDSPYNTYNHVGLPPQPISNPGLKSIEAAISPAKSSYLYFISDKDGHVHFAKTLQEHNQNIANYLAK